MRTAVASLVLLGSLILPARSDAREAAPSGKTWETVAQGARHAWWALRGWNCGNLVDSLARFDPFTRVFGQAWEPAASCASEVREQVICELPEAVSDHPALVSLSARAAWENGALCIPRSSDPGPMGLGPSMMCGLGLRARAPAERAAECVREVSRDPALRAVLAEIHQTGGCKGVAKLAFDILLGVLTGSSSIPDELAKWVGKLEGALSAYDWDALRRTLGAGSVESAVAAARHLARRHPACLPVPALGELIGARVPAP